jgi:hypothetical protein
VSIRVTPSKFVQFVSIRAIRVASLFGIGRLRQCFVSGQKDARMATKELKDHKAPEEMQSSLIFASFAIFCGSLLRSFLLRLFAPFCGHPLGSPSLRFFAFFCGNIPRLLFSRLFAPFCGHSLGSPSLRFFAFFCGHLPRPPSLRFFVHFCGYSLLLLLWLLVSPAWAASDVDLPGGTGTQPKPNRYGPFRNDPAQGIPKHAYSPFDDIGKPPPYTPGPGRDYKEGELVIKLKPHVAVQKAAMAGTRSSVSPMSASSIAKLTDSDPLNQILAASGITTLQPIFPNAKPPVARMTPNGKPAEPDLTRWYRAKSSLKVQEVLTVLTNDPGVEVAEPDYLRKLAEGVTSGG